MTIRSLLLATALFAFGGVPALAQTQTQTSAQTRDELAPMQVLRANVIVTSNVVRIGDVIDNAGSSAQIAIYRAPDLGTTGSLPVVQLLVALQAHQVIGVDTKDIKAVSVTRLSRAIEVRDIQSQVAHEIGRAHV